VGAFIGITVMLSQLYLTLFALFVSFYQQSKLDGDGLVASFSFFLFVLFVSFSPHSSLPPFFSLLLSP